MNGESEVLLEIIDIGIGIAAGLSRIRSVLRQKAKRICKSLSGKHDSIIVRQYVKALH